MTKTQKAILDAVIQSDKHLSADEIYWIVKQQFPSIALGTIYRNLNHFADAHLIRRVARAGAPDYFEGNLEPHDHALCIRCGNMTDLEILNFKEYLKSQMDCEIVSFDLIVNCICASCAQRSEDKPDGENNNAAHDE